MVGAVLHHTNMAALPWDADIRQSNALALGCHEIGNKQEVPTAARGRAERFGTILGSWLDPCTPPPNFNDAEVIAADEEVTRHTSSLTQGQTATATN
eukprot:1414579-Amphidinium_carterae.1